MKTILYLTDLYYEAQGRNYYEEDLFLTSKLKPHFNILIGHPQQAISNLDVADLVVFRNTGPVVGFPEYFQQFLSAVKEQDILTFNSFDGKGDVQGKMYLLELTRLGYPVIPTVKELNEIERLGDPGKYILKIWNGGDSIGMETLNKEELLSSGTGGKLIQPYIDFEYEVSFYYLNDEFQYAMYAPDKKKRWELTKYEPAPGDLKFAEKFIKWNDIERGITRVDACRLKDGSLLLVELEDLNPFLSLDLLREEKRENFVENLIEVFQNTA